MTFPRPKFPLWWLSVLGAAVLAACLVAGLSLATSHPEQHRDRLKAAIVNNDEAVYVKGKYAPLGRQLAAKLMAQPGTLDWSLMTTQTAKTKLADGELVAVVTIPEDFSARASSMATGNASDMSRAIAHVEISDRAGVSDAAVVEVVTRAGMEALSHDLRKDYLNNVYLGLNKVHTKFGQAASSAQDLADGADDLDRGADSASRGADELVVGLKELDSGAVQLSEGIEKLSAGAQELHDGTGELVAGSSALTSATGGVASGAAALDAGVREEHAGIGQLDAAGAQLATGLAQLDAQTQQLPSQTQQLASGAHSVRAGAVEVSQGATQVAQGTAGVSAGASQLSSSLAGYSQQMQALAAKYPTDPDVLQAAGYAQALAENADQLSAGAQESAAGATSVSQGADSLVAGASQLEAGTSQLASSAPLLAGSVTQLSGGAASLSAGLHRLYASSADISAGSAQLAAGSSQLKTGVVEYTAGVAEADAGAGELASASVTAADGASTYVAGVSQAEDGGTRLARGLSQLSSGTERLSSGANTFAEKLAEGAASAPEYSAADRSQMKRTVSTPIKLAFGAAAQASTWVFFALLAVWFSTLAAFGFAPPVPHRLVESVRPTWRLALDGAAPALTAGVATAVLASIVLWFGLGLDPLRWFVLCVVLAVVGVAFALVNQAFVLLLSGWGTTVSILLAMAFTARALFSSLPVAFAPTFSATPLGAAWEVALGVATGGGPGLSFAVMLGWGLVSAAVVLGVVSKRRMATGATLRRGRSMPALFEG
jgi:putative membrane protein